MWLDTPYTNTNVPLYSTVNGARSVLSPILTDLSYLIEKLHIKATYKITKLGKFNTAAVRIYSVPNDVDGNRFIEDHRIKFRRGKTPQWHENKYKAIMKNFLAVLDYSKEHWEVPEKAIMSDCLIFSALYEFKPFSSKSLGIGPYYEEQTLDSHITRLIKCEPFLLNNKLHQDLNLETRLAEVYGAINFQIGPNNEVLSDVQRIFGLKSDLYNYQKESAAKMFINETYTFLKDMPYLVKIRRGSKMFYFNTINMTFNLHPEYYTSPRGGILAENMGLGKTCICLALICLTKFDTSETPEKFTVSDVHDYKIQSLFDQCVRHINRHSIPWKKHTNILPDTCIEALKKSPGFFYLKKNELPERKHLSRARPIVLEKKYLLTSATLIVCPDNLFRQWCFEIAKHLEPGALKIYYAEKLGTLPSSMELITYDIVLMANSAYVSESPDTSVLSKIYWKRLIIDEGHSMNQRSTRAVELSKELQVERKWAVTGTPTAGMTKLHMNETSETNSSRYTVKRAFSAKDDLTRLGLLVSNFFQIQPWANNQDLWNKIVAKPFISNTFNSSMSLESLISSLIVRHSSDQIENDVTLPPLYHKPVFLTPSYHNKLSVNLFVAVLAINAVSSEREDKDYMFHPGSKSDLRRLVTNLQRATFYWTGFSVDDLESMVYIAKLCLDKKSEDGSASYCPEDIKLLERSVKACKIALADKFWRTVSTIHEMNYFVGGLDNALKKNFQINKLSFDISVFGAPQLYSMQKFYFKKRFSSKEVIDERIQKFADEFWNDYWKEAAKKNAERVKKNDGQAINISTVGEELEHQEKLSLKSSKKSSFEDPNAIKSTNGRIQTLSDNSSASPTPALNSRELNRNSRLLGTSSAKLSYMVSKLLENTFSSVKGIVFFEFEDSAYYLSEALDLLGLNYTLYATSVHKDDRAQKIREFSEAEGAHTLIMDLKLASHGLTITAATQVYFLSPVWKRSIEAQAIKRAHRIGQKNPVHVETLVLKGTLEEEMYRKRQVVEDELNVPVADDNQIRDYILKFEFLKVNDTVPFNEFKSRSDTGLSEINKREFDDVELLEPSALKIKNTVHWNVPLFGKNALEKQSEHGKNTEVTPKVDFSEQGENLQGIKFVLNSPKKVTFEEPKDEKLFDGSEDTRPKKKVRFT